MTARDRLKRLMPGPARAALSWARRTIGPAPIDDAVLRPYAFAAAPDAPPRLSLVIPGLDPASAFGGVNTCMEFLLKLHARLCARRPDAVLRLITERGEALDQTVAPRVAAAAGLSLDGVVVTPAPPGAAAPIPTGPRDVFMAYNWWCSLNIHPVLEAQAARYGAQTPKLHFLQDYEPHFYEFSSAQLMARQAFNLDWPLWLVVNTAELADYYRRMGDRADRLRIFEPTLNPALRPYVAGAGAAPRRRRLLVYARPAVARNCWPLARRALQAWSTRPESAGWEVVSAGADHPPVDLGDGRKLRPLGKLSLEAYAATLCETAVGLSLMTSPHPSYPPLEMAHFGVRVVTNGYVDKDLARRHDAIVSLADARAEAIAEALAQVCAAFDADPAAPAPTGSRMPAFLDGDFDCLDVVADDVTELWR